MAALAVAILLAPMLALLYGLAAALVVMATGLIAVSYLLRDAAGSTSPLARRWLRAALVVNLTLALACLLSAIWLTVGH